MAACTAAMPVLALPAQAAGRPFAADGGGEPPSSQTGLLPVSIDSVRAQAGVADSLAVSTDQLNEIQIGKSLDTEAQEAAAVLAERQRIQAEQEVAAAAAAAALRRQQAEQEAAERARQAAAPPVVTVAASGSVEQIVHEATAAAFGEGQWAAMRALILQESGFNPNSYNTRSGACGIYQALPCSKMGGMGLSNQISWGIGYIRNRYGTPAGALAFHNTHGWY